jgi:hypothetical protein
MTVTRADRSIQGTRKGEPETMAKKKWLGLAALGAALVLFGKKLVGRGPKKTGMSEEPPKEEPN